VKRKADPRAPARTSGQLPPAEHTEDCIYARGGPDEWPSVWDLAHRARQDGGTLAAALNVAFVKAIDACPHRAHDAYRLIYCRPPADQLAEATP
jgi:hypothetical protein